MTIIDAIILGFVEGFTEFLPVSSTAHLILASHTLGLDHTAFVKTFEISIQSAAIAAVVAVYWRSFLDMEILKRLVAAFLPTAFIGFALYEVVKEYLLGNLSVVLWALGVGGALLIAFELWLKRRGGRDTHTPETSGIHERSVEEKISDPRKLSYRKAAYIGAIQAIAVVPGVSRSAATIIGGLTAGMSRAAIVEFSFLLAVPTIAAATVLDVYKNISLFTADQAVVLGSGFVAAFATALLGIRFLLAYVRGRSFIGFGVYRIVIALAFALLFL